MFYENFLLTDDDTGVALGHTLMLDESGQPVAEQATQLLDMRANAAAYRAESRWLGALTACNTGATVPAAAEALDDAARRGAHLLGEQYDPNAPAKVHERYIGAHRSDLEYRAAGLEDWAELGYRAFSL